MEQSDEDREESPRRRAIVVWAKRAAVALLFAFVVSFGGAVFALDHYEKGLPSTAELKTYSPPQVTRILARDGTLLGELFTERRTVVPFDKIPDRMRLAALAAEDAGFYEHAGLNYLGMLRAILVNLRSGGAKQGGSTITQQVVKNMLLTPEKTMGRKIREAILARRIEEELTKDEILELYLNHIYFGHGRYGVEEAARYYFGKGVADVTLAEAATLAGLVKAPGMYSPRIDPIKSKERRDQVLTQMLEKGFAPADQVEAAKKEPIVVALTSDSVSEIAPEVVDEVRRKLREIVGPSADHGGYTVTTTIDPALETAARAAVRRNADEYAKRHKLLAPFTKAKKEPLAYEGEVKGHKAYLGAVTGADDAKNTLAIKVGGVVGTLDLSEATRYNPKALPPSQFAEIGKTLRVTFLGRPSEPSEEATSSSEPPPAPKLHLDLGPESALVAVDVRSREILALVGSYEAVRGGLDRTSAHRQPGSTFKAFVYGYAIHARTFTPASILETQAGKVAGYSPQNYDESEGKSPKRLREALANSVNVAAAWTLSKVGPDNVVGYAHSLGIDSKLGADLSLALGSYEVTPREMASAYATLAAGGVAEEPILIRRIVGPNGEVALPARAPAHRVMEANEAYVLTSLLESVVNEGTAKRAKSLGRPIAGKTGTSNDSKDGWFVGYSTDIACAVWTGYDDPMSMGKGEVGATVALPAFVDFMREAHQGRAATDFPVPQGVAHALIDPETGLRAWDGEQGAIDEVFVAGTEPSETAKPADDAGAPDAPSASDAGNEAPSAQLPTREAPPPF